MLQKTLFQEWKEDEMLNALLDERSKVQRDGTPYKAISKKYKKAIPATASQDATGS